MWLRCPGWWESRPCRRAGDPQRGRPSFFRGAVAVRHRRRWRPSRAQLAADHRCSPSFYNKTNTTVSHTHEKEVEGSRRISGGGLGGHVGSITTAASPTQREPLRRGDDEAQCRSSPASGRLSPPENEGRPPRNPPHDRRSCAARGRSGRSRRCLREKISI